jgi:hypothetical protein
MFKILSTYICRKKKYIHIYTYIYIMQCCVAALHTVSFVTRLFRGKMHSDWFNGTDILQGGWKHKEKVGYCYPSGLEKTLCKWEVYVPLVTKGLNH